MKILNFLDKFSDIKEGYKEQIDHLKFFISALNLKFFDLKENL